MLASALYERALPARGGYRDISPQAAYEARGKVRLIDVREPHEFTGELGHLPGAELVPVANVLAAASGWDKDAELILICRSGARSGRVAESLVAAGFHRVMNMAGGMLSYRNHDLPAEHTTESP